ncbi:unnamed protein product [Cylicocyclus nassatus]|uniref:Uncharacterized protein n=1 Tax=Cylicocyclus nassatus TaxID=53992 RepID=A0AA36GI28_CYLNA|nr:unnamed protein product [Cylicocyclus nassatus]
MAKRRRRSSGGKDGNYHHQSAKKREVVEDISTEKTSAKSDGCSSSGTDTKSTDGATTVNKRDHSLGVSSQELSSVMQQIKLSSPEPPSKNKGTSNVSRATRKGSKGRSSRRLIQRNSHAKENSSQKQSTTSEKDDEVVHDSQEAVDSPAEPSDEKLLKEPAEILALYKRLTGIERKPPEKVGDPLRNEYRQLFCVGTICENLSNIMTARLASAGQLRKQRLDSLTQLKALTSRLEDMNYANSAIEK